MTWKEACIFLTVLTALSLILLKIEKFKSLKLCAEELIAFTFSALCSALLIFIAPLRHPRLVDLRAMLLPVENMDSRSLLVASAFVPLCERVKLLLNF